MNVHNSTSKIRAVIFDMDGLIVDTESIHSKAAEKIILKYNKTPDFFPNGLLHVIGQSGSEENLRFLNKYGLEISEEELKKQRRAFFVELLQEKLTPLPGFMPLLHVLKNNGFRIALASNRYEKHIHLILDKLEVTKFFEIIVGPSDDRLHKPHPDIYLHTAKELGVKSEQCLVLEDSEIGIASAKAAGMKVIAIPNEFTAQQDLSKADIILDSLDKVNVELIQTL